MANKVEQLFFVLPLNLVQDPNKNPWGPEIDGGNDEMAVPAPREGRGDRGRFGNIARGAPAQGIQALDAFNLQQAPQQDWPVDAGQQQPVLKGRGFFLSSESRKKFEKAFTTEEMAISEAKEMAERFPKTPFGIFSCIGVFETTTPKVIEKSFNEAGELRVKQ